MEHFRQLGSGYKVGTFRGRSSLPREPGSRVPSVIPLEPSLVRVPDIKKQFSAKQLVPAKLAHSV